MWANFHVFYGVGQFIKGKSRGRCPFVSFERIQSEFDRAAVDGSMEASDWQVRIDVGGRDKLKRDEKLQEISRVILQQLQAQGGDWQIANYSIGESTQTPWGAFMIININKEDVDCNNNYNQNSGGIW